MRMIELELRPDRARLRQFGWIALVVFGALGGWARWKGHLVGIDLGDNAIVVARSLFGIASVSAIASIVWPPANRPLYTLLTLIAFPIGTVVSYVLMGVLFYLVITPVGLWFRLIGRDALERRIEPDRESYWAEHVSPEEASRYFKQF